MEKDKPWTLPPKENSSTSEAEGNQPTAVVCCVCGSGELVEKDHPARAIWELVAVESGALLCRDRIG